MTKKRSTILVNGKLKVTIPIRLPRRLAGTASLLRHGINRIPTTLYHEAGPGFLCFLQNSYIWGI